MAADDVTIRPERPDDHGGIRDVVASAFRSPNEAALVDSIRASTNFVPELSLVAELDGRIVGHVMISFVSLDDGAARHRIASLAPLGVAPSHQRRGIGSALVREVTSRAAARGEALVVLEGSPVYYGRLGFEDARRHGIRFDLPAWAPPEAGQVMRLSTENPAPRGRVVYPPAFQDVTAH
jgi:putative acetyltransferase